MRLLKSSLVLFFVFYSFSFAQAQSPTVKEWTFLVYINGHNNLSSFGDMNIIDMEKVGSTADVNILTEWGSFKPATYDSSGYPATYKSITKRLYVQKSTVANKVTSPVLQEFNNYDMGDYKNLQKFIRWGVQNYPARHYFVAVWNHGAGWHSMGAKTLKSGGGFSPLDISFDDATKNFISTEQMGLVMADAKLAIGKNVDIYGSDACLMQMIESAGEMKDSVDYVIGSQELEPAQGWPYFPFLRKWTAAPTMTPKELAVLLSKEYLAGYELGGVYGPKPDEEPISGITMSVLDMSKLDNLYDSLRNLTSKINSLAANDFKKIHAVSGSFLRYTSDDYVDLGQLIKTLRTLKINQINLETLDSVEASLSDVVVTTDNDANYAEATGLSIWMPTMVYNGAVTSTSYKNALKEYNKLQLRYEKLKSSLATDWGQFTKKTISTF